MMSIIMKMILKNQKTKEIKVFSSYKDAMAFLIENQNWRIRSNEN